MGALRLVLCLSLLACTGLRRPAPAAVEATQFVRPLPPLPVLTNDEKQRAMTPAGDSRSVGLAEVEFDLPSDYVLGQWSWGVNGVCTHGNRSINSQRWFGDKLPVRDVFASALAAHGYVVADNGELRAVAHVTQAALNFCAPEIDRDVKLMRGAAWVRVEWVVVSARDGARLFEGVSEGITRRPPSRDGTEGIIRAAFEDAAHRLALNERFAEVVGRKRATPKVAAR